MLNEDFHKSLIKVCRENVNKRLYLTGKPKSLDGYLRKFIDEANFLCNNGLDINEQNIRVKIRAFICDTPARAHLKGFFLILFLLFI